MLHPFCPVGEASCSGNNLGIARYRVGAGRPEEPDLRDILDGSLNGAVCCPRRRTWIAVRRKFNKAADEAAT
eukprot:3091463-Lingulodinium_polyedra.AAC.1